MGTGTEGQKAPTKRETWTGKLDFVMAALSLASGMGNLWRFHYQCYKNGGGAFLIPYIISMILAGFPLMFIELTMGQFAGAGIVSVWKACPLFEGIGWGMFMVSTFTSIYYNVVVSWCFFYLFASLARDVPWRDCGNWWNTEACTTFEGAKLSNNCTNFNGTWWNNTCYSLDTHSVEEYSQVLNYTNLTTIRRTSAPEEYYNHYMLAASDGLDDFGSVRWHVTLCLLLSWIVIFICMSRGIHMSGKIMYFTAIFPTLALTILLVRSITLEGSWNGVMFYLYPDWSKLLTAQVWGDAAVQAFFSLSLCWGGLITLASYNKFNHNCLRDSVIVAFGDMFISLYSGFVIFSILGYMAHDLGVEVKDVADEGPGLAFVVYPLAVTKLPAAPLWSVLFMIMLITLGVGTMIGLVSTIQTTLVDRFPNQLRQGRRPLILLAGIISVCFLLALPMTTQGGVYLVTLMDAYAATYALMFLGLCECIALAWIYGIDRFYKDIEQMLGYKPGLYWRICWRYITPVLILGIFLFILIDFKPTKMGEYQFPTGWELVGWVIAIASMITVPITAVIKILTQSSDLSLGERIRFLCQPTEDWGPTKDRILNGKGSIEPEAGDEFL